MAEKKLYIEKNSPSTKAALVIFLGPALSAIFVFFFIPVVSAIVLSFSDFDIYALGHLEYVRFTGLANYKTALSDPLFWKAMFNTFYFVLAGAPLSVIASLGAALLLNSKMVKFKSAFRLAYFLPVVTSLVAVAIIWRFIYHPRFGMLNYFLSFFGIAPTDWLGDTAWAMPSLILMSVWKNFGYNMMIFLAGLQSIPDYLYEAAVMEGANWWQQFKRITLPMLVPTSVFVGIVTMIGYFQLFAEPYIMTQGGPLNSTLSVVQYMYQEGFRWWNMGYSASIAFCLFIVIFVGAMGQLWLQKKMDL